METRIIDTGVWRDPGFMGLDDKECKILFFLLTNDKISVLPAYQISLPEIAFYCGTTTQKVEETIPKLVPFGICYIEGYFVLEDKFTRAQYKGGKTENKRERLWKNLPPAIQEIVDVEGSIAQSLSNDCPTIGHINHKPENINHKPEIKKQKYSNFSDIDESLMEDIATDYNVPLDFVKQVHENMGLWLGSKNQWSKYSNYNLALRSWVKRDADKLKLEMAKAKSYRRGGVADARGL